MVVLQQLVGLDAPLVCTLFSTLRGPLSLPSRPARAVSRRLAPGGWGTPAMWQLGGHRLLAPAVGLRATSTAAVSSCRAVMLPRFGGPEVLEVRPAVGVPSLKPRDVLVRSRAVSINPLDLRMRSGYGRSIFEPLLPLIIGRDISGEVAAVGTSVSSLTVGQEVFGALHPTAVRGTYADYAILSEDELTLKPPSVTHVKRCKCNTICCIDSLACFIKYSSNN